MVRKKIQYDEIANSYSEIINPTKEYAILSTVLKITGSLKNKDILDLACGDGFFTRRFAEQNPNRIVGIDISSEMISLANKKKSNQNIHYQVGDALNLHISDEFDVITSIYLLDYAKNKKELLQMCENIYTHLKSNGIFSGITITPKLKLRTDYERDWKIISLGNKTRLSDGDPIRFLSDPSIGPQVTINCFYWTEKTIRECLFKAGFKDITFQYKLSISDEGKSKYPVSFWNTVQKHTAAVGIKAIK